jgi:hypothetical protein
VLEDWIDVDDDTDLVVEHRLRITHKKPLQTSCFFGAPPRLTRPQEIRHSL